MTPIHPLREERLFKQRLPSCYTLYEDDGISEGYLGVAYSTTKFSADDSSGHVVVTIGAQATAKYAY